MIKTTYYCNLCKEEVERNELLTLYFKCDIIPQQYVLIEGINNINSSDKHICKKCVRLIKQWEIKTENNKPIKF